MKNVLTAAQKKRLLELVKYVHHSYPNGSNYSEQGLKIGTWPDVSIRFQDSYVKDTPRGYYVKFVDVDEVEEIYVSPRLIGAGNGKNWGAIFCTEDKVLEALR